MLDLGEIGFKTGKGWQEWTPEQMKDIQRRLKKYLIEYSRETEEYDLWTPVMTAQRAHEKTNFTLEGKLWV
jgi:hypothetical protein